MKPIWPTIALTFLLSACDKKLPEKEKLAPFGSAPQIIRLLYDSTTIAEGEVYNDKAIGLWRYNNINGNPLISRQYSFSADSSRVTCTSRYYSEDGRILVREGIVNNTIVERDFVDTDTRNLNQYNLASEILFMEYCTGCHSISIDVKLKQIETRKNKNWLYRFVREGKSMAEKGDTAAIRLQKESGNVPHPEFPFLTDEDVHAILTYINLDHIVE